MLRKREERKRSSPYFCNKHFSANILKLILVVNRYSNIKRGEEMSVKNRKDKNLHIFDHGVWLRTNYDEYGEKLMKLA
jgi:hypothetical protein